jgi:hypothetical protein
MSTIDANATVPQSLSAEEFVAMAAANLERGYAPIPIGRRDKRGRFKAPWISGYHGYERKTATPDVISAWPALVAKMMQDGTPGVLSLGLVLPPNVVGFDVDAYDGKPGRATLKAWRNQWGKLPPTYIVTSRFDGSGIRLYRKPANWEAQEQANSGVDFIDSNHRYTAAPPSWHHTGHQYRLRSPEGEATNCGVLPSCDDLPELPAPYRAGLARSTRAVQGGSIILADFIAAHITATKPRTLQGVASLYAKVYETNGEPHNAAKAALDMGFSDAAVGFLSAADVYEAVRAEWVKTRRPFKELEELAAWTATKAQNQNGAITVAKATRDYGTDTRNEQQDMDDKDVFGDQQLPWQKYALTSAKELAAKVNPVRWLVSGVWPERSAGGIAGKKKTFKTWSMHSLCLAVATQLNYLDEFPVITAGPTLYLTGEGGEDEFKSRHRAIAKRYRIGPDELNALPFHAMFPVAPLDDEEFLDALKHHLDKVQPVLVCIDPLYAYHPKDIDVSNVYSRGPMLAKMREIVEPYAALIIGDHINKSADDSRLDLDDIGFSGMSQWADSWSLQRHREKFQIIGSESFAKLEVEFGSRRTGSMRYDVDWHLVRDMTDPHVILWDTCDWVVNRPNSVGTARLQVLLNEDGAIRALQNYVDANPTTNKTNATNKLPEMFRGFSRDDWRALWDKAIGEEYVLRFKTTQEQPYRSGTRMVEITRFKRGREVGKAGQW